RELAREGLHGPCHRLAACALLPRRRLRLAADLLLRAGDRRVAVHPDRHRNAGLLPELLEPAVQRWMQLAVAPRPVPLDALEHGVRIDLAARSVEGQAHGGAGGAVGRLDDLDIIAVRAAIRRDA